MAPLLVLLVSLTLQNPDDSPRDCADWHECRQLALDAAAERQYERFHDLAWRAVQNGPPRDVSLMYILARAQSLSGRPHDALVMLVRLAELGTETDAAVNEEFAAVRRLPQWPEVEARLRGASESETGHASGAIAGAVPPDDLAAGSSLRGTATEGTSPAGRTANASGASAGRATAVSKTGAPLLEDVLRVPALAMVPVALAHDRASGRFVFGDAPGRKLVIVDERRYLVVDLVRESSAGFYDITAFEIDGRRGDLWVASADRGTGATALHHLQLVSGRPLRRVEPANDLRPARFVDVAVTREGVVYVLDAAAPRLFALAPKASTLALVASLDIATPSSVAPAPGGVVYVAGPGGLTRVNVRTGRAFPVHTAGAPLPALARVRWHAGTLVGIAPLPDGTSHIIRIPVGTTASRAGTPQVIVSGAVIPDPSAATIEGDAVYYVSRDEAGRETVVKRIALR